MAKMERYRLRYTFWLNHRNPDEAAVGDTIERLKNERSFATVARDGIMIVNELRQGKIDLLLKLYPWVADAIRGSAGAGGAGGNDDVARQLAELKKLIQEQGAGIPGSDYTMKPATKTPGSAKPIAGAGLKPLLPRFDDDDDTGATVVLNKVAYSDEAGLNFLKGIAKHTGAGSTQKPA